MNLYCVRCDKELPEKARFCPYCGSELGKPPPEIRTRPSRKKKLPVSYCMKCGEELPRGALFCHRCGEHIKALPKPVSERLAPAHPRKVEALRRPTAVTAAAILFYVFGVLGLLSGVLVWVVTASVSEWVIVEATGISASYLIFIGLLSLIFGFLYLAVGRGLWKLKKGWAYFAVVLCSINIVGSGVVATYSTPGWFVGSIVGVITSGIILLLVGRGWYSLQ